MGTDRIDLRDIFILFVDYLMPELTPYEASVYIYLVRHSDIKDNTAKVRVGKRTLAKGYGKGSRGDKTNYTHINKILHNLEKKGCIKTGDTDREGTLYSVILPHNVPMVVEKLQTTQSKDFEDDYFNDPSKREYIFVRDSWVCQYCGEKVNAKNATLDHYLPQVKGGKHNKDNLRTCCIRCNAIKSGKTYEEAAPYLLKDIKERKERAQND